MYNSDTSAYIQEHIYDCASKRQNRDITKIAAKVARVSTALKYERSFNSIILINK